MKSVAKICSTQSDQSRTATRLRRHFPWQKTWPPGERKDIKVVATRERNPSPRRRLPMSRWYAVVVERALEKLFQFEGAGARAFWPENSQNGLIRSNCRSLKQCTYLCLISKCLNALRHTGCFVIGAEMKHLNKIKTHPMKRIRRKPALKAARRRTSQHETQKSCVVLPLGE